MPYKDPKTSGRKWYARPENKERVKARRATANAKARQRILDFYGNKCAVCPVADVRVLQVDHVFGDGAKERKERGHSRYTMWRRIQTNPERYQLLCANCNWIKRFEKREHNLVTKTESQSKRVTRSLPRRKMFNKKVQTKYQIVEVEKTLPLQEVGPELKESLRALQFHPAFAYLMNRFALKRAALATALHEGLDLTETQLRYLQAGIFWMGHLDRELKVLTQTPQSSPRPASDYEAEQFQQLQANLELVGA